MKDYPRVIGFPFSLGWKQKRIQSEKKKPEVWSKRRSQVCDSFRCATLSGKALVTWMPLGVQSCIRPSHPLISRRGTQTTAGLWWRGREGTHPIPGLGRRSDPRTDGMGHKQIHVDTREPCLGATLSRSGRTPEWAAETIRMMPPRFTRSLDCRHGRPVGRYY